MISTETLSDVYKIASCISRVNDVAKYHLKIPLDRADHLRDAFSHAQLQSKIAVLDHLRNLKNCDTVILGQWHGMLGLMLQRWGISKNVVGVELDSFWHDFSKHIITENYTALHGDATLPSTWQHLLEQENNLVVNTSCEHMSWDWLDFKRSGTSGYLYAQSNNYVIDDHINLLTSVDELAAAIESRGFTVLITKTLKFAPYDRYCVVAQW